jgi:hypothetical protein
MKNPMTYQPLLVMTCPPAGDVVCSLRLALRLDPTLCEFCRGEHLAPRQADNLPEWYYSLDFTDLP